VPAEKYRTEDRTPAVTFSLQGYHHALLSSILSHEYGIETRAGTICNHRLVRRWMEVDDDEQKDIEERIREGDRLASYGIVRASIGIHNTHEDIRGLVDALLAIASHGPKQNYTALHNKGIYVSSK
jgi:selenocysteine lyase/cysteine desulfurase